MVKHIFIDIQKFKYYTLLAESPVKINIKLCFFAINNDIQKLSFWKVFAKKPNEIKVGLSPSKKNFLFA